MPSAIADNTTVSVDFPCMVESKENINPNIVSKPSTSASTSVTQFSSSNLAVESPVFPILFSQEEMDISPGDISVLSEIINRELTDIGSRSETEQNANITSDVSLAMAADVPSEVFGGLISDEDVANVIQMLDFDDCVFEKIQFE